MTKFYLPSLFLVVLGVYSPPDGYCIDPNKHFFEKGFVNKGFEERKETDKTPPSLNTPPKDSWTIEEGSSEKAQSPTPPSSLSPSPLPPSPSPRTPNHQAADSAEYYRDIVNKVKSASDENQGRVNPFRPPPTPSKKQEDSLQQKQNTAVIKKPGAAQNSTKATLSLIVSSTPRKHLIESLKKIVELQKKQHIVIKDVFLVGFKDIQSFFDPEIWKTMEKFHFDNVNLRPLATPPKEYSIKNSPTWIVTDQGKDYVYEGSFEPSHLFTGKGEFRGPPSKRGL